eukprot:3457437-Pleurochrysis_carterae.AAC.1
MAGAFEKLSSHDAHPLEVKDDVYSGLLARVRGSPDPKVARASRSSRVAGESEGHSESVLAVHGSSDLDMADALDESSSRDVRPLEVRDDAYSGLLAR